LVSAAEFWFNDNFGHAAGPYRNNVPCTEGGSQSRQQTTRTYDAGPGGIIRSVDPRMRDQDYRRSRR